jgi:alkylated DNA nucleotide flippase Atl1
VAGADLTCPLTTGIFLNIIAGATEEALAEGRSALAPYWRVVDERGGLPPKFPPGRERQAEHLRAEGHRLGRDRRVLGAEQALVRT